MSNKNQCRPGCKVPSEFYQIEQNITEINNHPPYPGSDGYWMIWNPNTHEYEKSDKPIPEGSLPDIDESTSGKYLTNDGEKSYWAEVQGGGGGEDKTYVFTQAVPADVWLIEHNLNKYPSVSVIDTGNNLVCGDVEYVDTNTVRCKFSSMFSGKAYLN